MKNTRLLFITLGLAVILLIPMAVNAYTLKTDKLINVAKDETVDGNLYALADSIIIEGVINGDLFCAGHAIKITGRVEGDVFCAGQTIDIAGDIGGSVRVGGNIINISGTIAKNVQVIGVGIYISEGTKIGWDAFIAGSVSNINAEIGGDLHGVAGSVIISGKVGKNIKLRLDERLKGEKYAENYSGPKPLQINPKTEIGGNVYYISGVKGDISNDASIGGEIGHSVPKKTITKDDLALVGAWSKLIFLFAALIVGLVLVSVWGVNLKEITTLMINQSVPTIGWGIVIMFVTPIVVVLLIFTLIGIPLALIIMSLWIIAMYICKIIVGILIGRSLLEQIWNKKKESMLWAMIIGVIISWLVYSLPVVGWMFTLVAFWWGLGGLWLYIKKTK